MQKQYGAIPYLQEKGKLKVVLITSASGYWIFPKGRFEEDLGKRGTAELEALEEAGVKGRLRKDTSYRTKVYIKSGEQVELILYTLKVDKLLDEWKEDYRRERKVVAVAAAEKLMSSDALIKCLWKFARDMAV